MDLTFKERFFLINQYRILELLDSESADYHKKAQTMLANGFELEYSRLASNVAKEPFSREQCKEVLDVLEMFEALDGSYRNLDSASGIDKWKIRFHGYDGNHEGEYLAYVRFLVEDDRFVELVKDSNSHMPMVKRYREMLDRFRKLGASRSLTKEQILEVVG